jgi:predicted phosphodiesterase
MLGARFGWMFSLLLLAGCSSSPGTDEVVLDDTGGGPVAEAGAGGSAGKAGGGTGGRDSGTVPRDGGSGGGSAGASGATGTGGARDAAGGVVKIGVIADIHEGRNNQIPGFITEAVDHMKPWGPDVIVALGDLVDHAGEPQYGVYVFDLFDRYAITGVPRAIIPGNHDFEQIDLPTYLTEVPADVSQHFVKDTSYGSFDVGGLHLVMIDGEYSATGTHNAGDTTHVAQVELDWMKADITATTLPTIVLTHEALAGPILGTGDRMSNYQAVVAIMQTTGSGKVIASFSGHTHADEYGVVNKIHYFTINSLFDLTFSPGYTTHDKGSHGQVTVDLGARTLAFEFWENDSTKGYQLAHTENVAF